MGVECPFSPKTANERVVRLTAFLVVVLMLTGLYTYLRWISLFLCIDFVVRGFTDIPYSPVKRAAKALARLLRKEPKMINAGPKIFAARIGAVFCAVISGLAFAKLQAAADTLAQILVLLAGMEAFLGICVGCHAYSLLQRAKRSLPSKKTE